MASYRQVKNNQGVRGWARLIPFSYVVPIVVPAATLANGATQSGTIQTDPGLPFILTEMSGAFSLDVTNTPTFQNLLNFTILDGESQQNFSNGPVPRERMFGTREFPRQLPQEVEISPADLLTVNMTNLSGAALAAGVVFYAVFTGFKLVGFSPSAPA